MVIEANFPRGGRKPPAKLKPKDSYEDYDLFGKNKKTDEEVEEFSDLDDGKTKSKHTIKPLVQLVTRKSLQDGMVLLGCVKNVEKVIIGVNLPGWMYGKVFINSISKPYTKLLQTAVDTQQTNYKQLKELFFPGQTVAVKVINARDEKIGISLTMLPQEINSNISYLSIQTGMLLWGAISSCEDHGYVVDLGINNCRAFLEKKNCPTEKEYNVGELLWFAVVKTEISQEATIVKLSTNCRKINKSKLDDDISLDHLLPGMKVDFTISEILVNGLSGKLLNDYTGYIHCNQLKKHLRDESEYKIGKTIAARIIYVQPITKLIFLTLKDLDHRPESEIKEGSILKCTVKACVRFGLYITIKNKKGFVPIHRLHKDIAVPYTAFSKNISEISDFEIIKRKYSKFSHHICRVLNYDYFEELYFCTLEENLVDQNLVFSLHDLKAGQKVSAEIKEVEKNGLLVQVQNVSGYIKDENICDGILRSYSHIKSKFKKGQTVEARVWIIHPENNILHLTMRPTLLNSDRILSTYEEAECNKQFPGVVKQITTNGLLIKFFGDVHGWVPNKYLGSQKVTNPEMMFKIGQLVNCTVKNITESNRMTLSLLSPENPKNVQLEQTEIEIDDLYIGEHVDVTVSSLTYTGLEVKVQNSSITAVIPMSHFSKYPNLSPFIAGMFKVGQQIQNVVCVSKSDEKPTLSLRDNQCENMPDFESLKTDVILPCSILTFDEEEINIEAPIKDFKKHIVVPKTGVTHNGIIPVDKLRLNQLIYAKITGLKKNPNSVIVSTKLSDVWDYDTKFTVEYFSEYFNDVLKIKEHLKLMHNPLADLKLGDVVSGIVKSKLENGGYILELNNGCKGVVQPQFKKENLCIDKKVEGIVLWVNFEEKIVEVALCTKLRARINPIQDGNISIPVGDTNASNAHAEILLVKKDFALGVLRGTAGKRQFIFFPTKMHPNDFNSYSDDYVIGRCMDIRVIMNENGLSFGLLKQTVKYFDTKSKNKLKSKRKLTGLETGEAPQKKKIKLDNSKKKQVKTKPEKETKKLIKVENILNKKGSTEKNENKQIKTKAEKITEKQIKSENVSKEKKNTKIDENIQIKIESDNQEIKQKKNKSKKRKLEENKVEIIVENEENPKKPALTEKRLKSEKKNTKIKIETEIENNQEVKQKKNNSKKRKLEENKVEIVVENEEILKKPTLPLIQDDIPVILPGASNFWNIPKKKTIEDAPSDDEEDQDQKQLLKLQKKKKMTPAERAELARLEEERIRKIENELADAENSPKTADQFDRLVLANPNNSLLWINYMAFHLEATEIEKARAIARKALNTIEFREEQEKLNIWIAFLNLENRYGTNDSFKNILNEAVKMNDSLSVYLQALNILSDSQKVAEFTDLLGTVTKKFKSDQKMWIEAGEACYKCDLKNEARNLMQRSLQSLEEKQHVNLLVKFAFMEAKFKDPERAEALLEKVLASYPRRVDVWTSYVDMLIKGHRIHIARNVLERAVGQKLPARKMKTLFSKYIDFETKFGDEETVKKVNELAANYVKNALT